MWKVVLPAVAILGLLLAGALHHRSRLSQERRAGSLRLEPRMGADQGNAGQPFPVRFYLRNVGREPVSVVTRSEVYGGADFSVHVIDHDGIECRVYRSVFWSDSLTPGDISMLHPGESVEIRDPYFARLAPSSGRFRLIAQYRMDPLELRARLEATTASMRSQAVRADLTAELEMDVGP